MKVWDRVGIELTSHGSAVRHVSVVRNVTDCATQLGHMYTIMKAILYFVLFICLNMLIQASSKEILSSGFVNR